MELLRDEQLSAEGLKVVFDQAAHESVIDEDGDLYVKDDGSIEFPLWVLPLVDLKVVKLFTFISVKQGASPKDTLEFVNRLNREVVLPTFYLTEEPGGKLYLYGHYFLPTQFGLDKRTLIAVARRFSSAFKYIGQLDEGDILP